MKTLLYFEEYESDLSKALRNRNDINVLFIRTDKNIKFFMGEYNWRGDRKILKSRLP